MRIKFLGAAGTVTGSSYVLTSDSGQSILIDLGMFQGIHTIDRLNYEPYEYDCRQLSGALLTHAHLDHCGRLPILLSKGFKGNIWMTPATRDLTEISLLDAAKVAKQDERNILFDKDLAEKTIAQFRTINYRAPIQVSDFTVTFRDAGHILGSASIEIEDKKANSSFQKIVFSGDLGNTPEDLLQATEFIDESDVVVMESTYGDRLHPNPDAVDVVRSEIQQIKASGGTLLIPAFSLDRTQELLHMIMHLKKEGKVAAATPVFMDSPMGQKATAIYMKYPNIFNTHIQEDLNSGNPFEFPGREIVEHHEESKAIHDRPGPKVIIAGSGMMAGGRILGHAIHYLPLASTRLLIVGYQGEGTIGRKLLEGEKEVIIEKMPVKVLATVTNTQAMSSHADQRQLLNWVKHIKNVKKIFLTHGEDGPPRPASTRGELGEAGPPRLGEAGPRQTLAKKISEEFSITDIVLPILHQEISI